jgi:hypothetical protein
MVFLKDGEYTFMHQDDMYEETEVWDEETEVWD